ncbi:hypothetical protein ZWY2020_059133 [Hordeum vulgare]|nr:hypothetical protein ZWY2020_059133 [Hordeum vulgare]
MFLHSTYETAADRPALPISRSDAPPRLSAFGHLGLSSGSGRPVTPCMRLVNEQPNTLSRGIMNDISELTETLTHRIWVVASFLAPPPPPPDSSSPLAAPAEADREVGYVDGEKQAPPPVVYRVRLPSSPCPITRSLSASAFLSLALSVVVAVARKKVGAHGEKKRPGQKARHTFYYRRPLPIPHPSFSFFLPLSLSLSLSLSLALEAVIDHISELTETLTRRIWVVASFLAPPPAPPESSSPLAAPAEADGEVGYVDGEGIAVIRGDLAEIEGFVELDKAMFRKISATSSAPRREIYYFSGFVVSILTGLHEE